MVRVSIVAALILTLVVSAAALAGPSDEPSRVGDAITNPTDDDRTVSAGAFEITWKQTNPDEIVDLSWNGSSNLVATWPLAECANGGDSEYFGNSWPTNNDVDFFPLVGWGTTGRWSATGGSDVKIRSSASGCRGTSGVVVATTYQFPRAAEPPDRIVVERRFFFGSTPYPYDFRPYIPRLYPRTAYGVVIHPNAAGTALLTEVSASCELGCVASDWDGSWFAVHNPTTGRGLIVRHIPSRYEVSLWIDQDGGSWTTASSIALEQPEGGFTGTVKDTQVLCFYDNTTWTPSLTYPPEC